ncbi:MAG: pyruvate kinase [Planctomycetota bacterium]
MAKPLPIFALLVLPLLASNAPAQDPAWDFTPKPMPRIPAGVVVGGEKVEGWSDPVLFVRGKLTAGDTNAVSDMVRKYGEMFNLVVLANVGQESTGEYYLDKVAVGFSTKIAGRNVVITRDTHSQLGANLGIIGGLVFAGNDDALKDAKQVARYRHGLVMDAPTQMLVGGEHRLRMVRHFYWVSKSTGKLGTLLWSMDDAGGAAYQTVGEMQLLPPQMLEDRVMHVDGSEFDFLGRPSKNAFALVRLPQGRAIGMGAELKQAAGVRRFDQGSYIRLLTLVSQSIRPATTAAR